MKTDEQINGVEGRVPRVDGQTVTTRLHDVSARQAEQVIDAAAEVQRLEIRRSMVDSRASRAGIVRSTNGDVATGRPNWREIAERLWKAGFENLAGWAHHQALLKEAGV